MQQPNVRVRRLVRYLGLSCGAVVALLYATGRSSSTWFWLPWVVFLLFGALTATWHLRESDDTPRRRNDPPD